MRIAIHPNAGFFSERWIQYCLTNSIQYKIVDCFNSNIIQELEDCDILLWHYTQSNYRDKLAAKQILFSIQQSGKLVFPDFTTSWHFDDKLGQKYLLESIHAPVVQTYVFYDKETAINWARMAKYPKVFKLRCGSGSNKVRKVTSFISAKRLICKSFSNGFPQFDRLRYFKERYRRFHEGKASFADLLKSFIRILVTPHISKLIPREKGYAYFQDFVPSNQYDIRVIVIGNKAFAIKRLNRVNDFRASGSGRIIYEKDEIDLRFVKLAFDINSTIKSQCIAYDFIVENSEPKVLEISFGFNVHAYDQCPGYWDSNLIWHEHNFNPQEWIIEDIINDHKSRCTPVLSIT